MTSHRRATDHPSSPLPMRFALFLALAAALLAGCGGDARTGASATDAVGQDAVEPSTAGESAHGDGSGGSTGRPDVDFEPIPGVTTALAYEDGESVEHWFETVPSIQQVRIPASADGTEQPAFWLPPRSEDGPRPLLVVLHSWSYGYATTAGAPFARWAEREGWAFIHPDFRGAFGSPDGTGSDLAVSDVIDAVDFAVRHDDVDADRVYVTGFSGGGMMSLLVAGRHPDRFAGVSSWVPIHDMVGWYGHTVGTNDWYAADIRAVCGADPTADTAAREDCAHRSPAAHLDAAREAGVPVYIGHGIDDTVVPVEQAVAAFEQLAGEPAEQAAGADPHFGEGDPAVVDARRAGSAVLVLFEGGHDMVYNPGLEWLVHLDASRTAGS